MTNEVSVIAKDLSKVVTCVTDVREARLLPPGVVVGDRFGGRSFTDNVAAVLEARSHGGWREVIFEETRWTVIELVSK